MTPLEWKRYHALARALLACGYYGYYSLSREEQDLIDSLEF